MIINNTGILQHMTVEEMEFLRDILGGCAFFIITILILIGIYKITLKALD